ncbi:beta-alanyl-dopamine/carcinine hydrolase-like [Periplaneta americana]|uniref:beta-alanyl-dopamine/carcinine hydrolase-like n=1 Tax=Periplaneta americana TaxID=6978 RepID=UPI0037E80EF7
MATGERISRRNNIPIIYTRGTHYEVGFDIGRTFSGLIQNHIAIISLFDEYLPLYETEAGRKVYEETLASVRKNFPQYVREMEGFAEGAKVPFYKLFLLHLDVILPNVLNQKTDQKKDTGCSTVCCNEPGEEIMGHTEDALAETLGHFYFVSAHIVSDTPQGKWKVKEEHFTSLCYAGFLPGLTMSYNHHGLAFTCNSIRPKKLSSGKTPGAFLLRAMLAAKNLSQVQQILLDTGCGAAEGISVNMTFLNQEGDRLFHNAEVGPAVDGANESELCIFTASPGEHVYHCNKYLRLQVPENESTMTSSNHRHATMKSFPKPRNRKDVINILGDQSDKEYSIFRETDVTQTIAVGIFDFVGKTLSVYADNPKKNDPILVLPLSLKSPSK